MQDRVTFLEKLGDMVRNAKGNGSAISIEEVHGYFPEGELTEEQMDMVFDYLLSQKIVVKGYLHMPEEEAVQLTEEDKRYLQLYEKELSEIPGGTEQEKQCFIRQVISGDVLAKSRLIELYLKEVVEIAKSMYHPELLIEDLVQEGNVGVVLGVELIASEETAETTILNQVRQSIQAYIDEYEGAKEKDKVMVDKVNVMDAAITELTEEMGRKVTVEELAVHLGITEDEVMDILHLTGEDAEEEEQMS